jgi:hypothetical protein
MAKALEQGRISSWELVTRYLVRIAFYEDKVKPGYPTGIVPFGIMPNAPANAPFPEQFQARPAPFGEQITKRRMSPPSN